MLKLNAHVGGANWINPWVLEPWLCPWARLFFSRPAEAVLQDVLAFFKILISRLIFQVARPDFLQILAPHDCIILFTSVDDDPLLISGQWRSRKATSKSRTDSGPSCTKQET
jgi:hypothetical protein